MQDFIHLHVHTEYSILDGQSSISGLVDKAIKDGMQGMAITDHGNMFAIKEYFNYLKSIRGKAKETLKKDGISEEERAKAERTLAFKPIFGCEMYCARRGMDKREGKPDQGGWHLIVLAKNERGYHNLIKLVSRAWTDGFYMRPRTDHKDLERYHEGLIICSACIAGEVPSKVLAGDMQGAEESIAWFKSVWGEDYYLELQRHQVKDPAQRANRETYPLQQEANKGLIALAAKHGVQLVCTNDVHFVDEENAEAHDRLICLSTGRYYDDEDRMLYSKQEWFKTQAEMNDIFADVPEALQHTIDICHKVEEYSIDHGPIMPNFDIPASFGTEEEYRQRLTEQDLFDEFTRDENGNVVLSREEAEKKISKLGGYDKLYRIKFEADYLALLTYEGAKRRYGDPLSEEVKERLNFELHIMKTMGFPGYFLIVQDYIRAAREELDVSVGPGRGSAAGSAVAYCLRITDIDPIKYDLLFERFLNPDRISLPDIDVDFDDDGRGRVLNWVTQKYGEEKVAHIITYGTMATKSALSDVARVQRLPIGQSRELCKLIPDKLPVDPATGKAPKMTLRNVIAAVPQLQQAEASPDETLSSTLRYACMLEGNVRNTGVHACGTIICRDDISDWVPVSTADDKETGGKLRCTQYEGKVIEETGLIKMDFLGLKTLSIIREALSNIRLSLGVEIDIDNIPIDDEATYKLYSEGRTIGVFQFESPGMQKHLRSLCPTVFGDLIAMNALYRPGPMKYIPEFIDRKQGRKEITYDLACMEKYLKDTYGITVYQEQVMLLSREIAGFTRGESDTLRKAMGKKLIEKLNHLYPKFIEGGRANGHDEKVLNKIWDDWRDFASYAFNKSHATCYSWVSYQTAYLKANFPSQYMAAVMTRSIGNIDEITKFMDECRAMGIKTLIPDVNESYYKFSVNNVGNIRYGMAAVKGVAEAAVTAIIKEREAGGLYEDVYDFFKRVNLSQCNRKTLEALILAGSFDSLGLPRETYFAPDKQNATFLETLVHFGQQYQQEQKQQVNSFFGGMEGVDIALPKPPTITEPWNDLEKLKRECEVIGIYLSGHPLDDYRVVLESMCNIALADYEKINENPEGTRITFGGIIVSVREGTTKRGKPYGAVKVEDFTGTAEVMFWGDSWAKWRGFMQRDNQIFVEGEMQRRFQGSDSVEMKVVNVTWLSDVKEHSISRLTVTLDSDVLDLVEQSDEEVVQETPMESSDTAFCLSDFISIVQGNPGQVPLYVKMRDKTTGYVLEMQSADIKVEVSRELLGYLRSCHGLEYSIN